MRIVYFYQYMTTPEGAWSTRCYELTRRWVAAGDHVTVVTSVYDKSDLRPRGLLARLQIEGVDVRVVNIRLSNKHGAAVRLLTFAAYAFFATWYALTLPADLIIASSGPITTGIPALVGHSLRRLPLVFEVRDIWPEGAIELGVLRNPILIRLARWFEGVCYRSSRLIVALSEGMADWVRRRTPSADVLVIPNAADRDRFGRGPGTPEPEHGLVVYTGTMGLMDDCGQILEAARILQRRRRSDIRLVLLGDGRERAALQERAIRHELTNLEFRGLVPKPEVVRWLHRATCAVITFRDVPVLATVSPNKLFDALAAGVPVIQTTTGWIRHLLETERAGISVPAGNPEAMASAIESLVDGPARRAELAANAARVAEELFSRDRLATRMHEGLRRAAGLPGASATPAIVPGPTQTVT
jgi:glycosyltransferase involved in cell wall biosynthesis